MNAVFFVNLMKMNAYVLICSLSFSHDELITIKIIFLHHGYLHRKENSFDKNRSIFPHLRQLFNLHLHGTIISLEISIHIIRIHTLQRNHRFDRGIIRQKSPIDENNFRFMYIETNTHTHIHTGNMSIVFHIRFLSLLSSTHIIFIQTF